MIGQWLAAVFTHPDLVGAAVIAAKTTIIYLFLIVGLRLLGKRELGQMTLYDLILIIVLANSVQNAMVGNDTSLLGGIIAATTLLTLNRLFNYLLLLSPALEREMAGEPRLIIQDGRLLPRQLRREGVTEAQVMAALREHEIDQISDVKAAILEVDGTISVVPREARILRTRHRVRGLRIT